MTNSRSLKVSKYILIIPLLGFILNGGFLFSQQEADSLNRLASTLRYEDPITALKYSHQSSLIADNPITLSNSHYQLGILLRNVGEYDSAYAHLFKAWQLRTALDDPISTSNTLNAMGTIFSYTGEIEQAIEKYKECLDLRTKNDASLSSLTRVWQNLANVYDAYEQYDSSKYYLDLQKEYIYRDGSPFERASYKLNYGVWLMHSSVYDSALYYFQESYKDFAIQQDTIEMLKPLWNIGGVYYEQNQFLNALNYYREGKELGEIYNVLNAKDIENLHQTYSALNQYDSAYYYLQLQKQLEDSLFTAQQANHLNLLRTLHEVEANNRQKQLLTANNRALMISLIFAGAIALSLLFGLYLNQRKRTAEKSLLLVREAHLQDEMISQLHMQESEAMQRMSLRLEEEYQKVARALHDQLGNLLVTARLNIQGLLDQLPTQSQQSQQQVRVADQSLETALQAIRQIAHQMHEGRINQLGLASILQELKATVESSGKLNVELDLIGVEQRLDANRERLAFQIIRELTTNVIKYAQATELSIQVVRDADQIEIMITDNGQGFPADFSPNDYGLGLRSVQADLAKLGGTLEIDSHPQHGATIIIDMPI